MGKKILYIVAGTICIALICLILWHFGYTFDFKRDSVKFKNSYEAYNGLKSESGEVYKTVSINKDNKIKYLTFEELIQKLSEGTSLIYLSSPTDSINRECVETIVDTIDKSDVDTLYYFETNYNSDDYKNIIETLNEDELNLPNIIAIRKGKFEDSLDLDYIKDENIDELNSEELIKNIDKVIDSLLKEDTFCDETC